MAKMTAEEKHKRQLAKLQAKEETESTYVERQTEKDLIMEQLEKKGFKFEIPNGVPMFLVEKQKEVDDIKSMIENKFSFGFKYPKNKSFIFDKE